MTSFGHFGEPCEQTSRSQSWNVRILRLGGVPALNFNAQMRDAQDHWPKGASTLFLGDVPTADPLLTLFGLFNWRFVYANLLNGQGTGLVVG